VKRLRKEVLEQAFEHLRACGAGRCECVGYLTGPVGDPALIDAVVHPRHTAGPGGYDLDSNAIAELWRGLVASERSIRIQVHTHPGAAYHSSRDDALALVHTPGFLSLVIPDFALGPVGFDGAFLARRTQDGRWVGVSLAEFLAITP
jgi:proteasome lid subunit RPN8/RPN11